MPFESNPISLFMPQFRSGPSADAALVAAALGHGFQIPAMFLAGRVLRWRRRASVAPDPGENHFDPAELNRRIERVLELTIPIAVVGLSAIVALDPYPALESSLGRGVALLIGLELVLVIRRRLGAARQAFARRRAEIVGLILGLGVLVLVHREAMVSTPLGARLCLFSAALFLARCILQLAYYARVWPRSAIMRVGSWSLFTLFALQSVAYLHAARVPALSPARLARSTYGERP